MFQELSLIDTRKSVLEVPNAPSPAKRAYLPHPRCGGVCRFFTSGTIIPGRRREAARDEIYSLWDAHEGAMVSLESASAWRPRKAEAGMFQLSTRTKSCRRIQDVRDARCQIRAAYADRTYFDNTV